MVEAGADDALGVAGDELGLVQGVDLLLHVLDQLDGQLHGEVGTGHDTLHRGVLHVGRHRVRGHQPAAHAQAVGQVVERPLRIFRG